MGMHMNKLLRSLGDRMLTRAAPAVKARAIACCNSSGWGLCASQCRTGGLYVQCRVTDSTCAPWKLCRTGMC
jgi:hypothetical protein